MTPPETGLDTTLMLTWTAWMIRDILALFTLAAALGGFPGTLFNYLVRKRPYLDARTITGGPFAWLITAVACLVPVDQGTFFNRLVVITILALSALLFIFTIIFYRQAKSHKK